MQAKKTKVGARSAGRLMADRIALNRFSLQLVDAENQLGRMVLYYFHPKKRRTMEAIRVAFFISKIFVDEKFIHLVFIQKKSRHVLVFEN